MKAVPSTMPDPILDPIHAKRHTGEANKALPVWYHHDISNKLSQRTRHFLEEYSHIPPSGVTSHIHLASYLPPTPQPENKKDTYKHQLLTSLGMLPNPSLPKHPSLLQAHPHPPKHTKRHPPRNQLIYGLGSDLRALVADGVCASKLIATDIVNFWDLGYEMYNDRQEFSCRLI
ncbi:hypothetical protein BO78DRAFT_423377 [Aspergillus sclerotiicarbonarius CBS 121057]|uniref:Uncharacterized protein n=1 Tax=Aspergillus sclerotiicarbonarius (strain CBS 121057 / IBT 28362) TaxID=1448318 RepID=A0A319DV52_ASPSB|nr:hypothetical protein BO78DRAFT_423377 [Aspergillus sclerotiicarbonarius CBS 121057]